MLRRLIDAVSLTSPRSNAPAAPFTGGAGSGLESLEPRVLLSASLDYWPASHPHLHPGSANPPAYVVTQDDRPDAGADIGVNDVSEADLAATVNDSKLPSAVITGNGDKLTLPITITNQSNINAASGAKVDIAIFARPADAGDGSQDVLVTTLPQQSVSGLKASKSKTINARFTLPADLELSAGDYIFVVHVDSGDAIPEPDEDNNIAITEAAVSVTPGQVDLSATLNESKLPASIISGTAAKVSMPVTVTNQGNIALPSGTKVAIQIVARPVDAGDDSQDVLVATLSNQSLSKLKAGKSKTINAKFTLPPELADGEYNLIAIIDSAQQVAESNEANNTASTDASIDVAQAHVNLVAEVDGDGVPSGIVTGASKQVTIPVTVANQGNVALASGAKVAITFVARPADASDDSQDIILTTLSNQSVSKLKPGKSKTIKAKVTLPDNLPEGNYHLLAIVDSADAVTESNELDNESTTLIPLTVAEPFVNLAASLAAGWTPPASVTSGLGKTVTLPVVVTNQGNIATPADTRVSVTIHARPADACDDSQDVPISIASDVNLGNLQAGASKGIAIRFELPDDLESGQYHFVAVVDSENQVEESDEDDNQAVSAQSVTITQAQRDLTVSVDDSKLPASAIAGSSKRLTLPVTVTNAGSAALPLGQTIQITVKAVGEEVDDVLVCVVDYASVSGLGAGSSKLINVTFALPEEGDWVNGASYQFRVEVDTCDVVHETDEENNTATTEASVIISRGGVNLTGSIDESAIPSSTTSGTGQGLSLPITVINAGDKRLASGQRIDIRIVARTDGDPQTDIEVGLLESQSVSQLAAGASRSFVADIDLPLELETSENVRLVVLIDSNDDLSESNESDNEILSGVISVTQGVQDLGVAITDEAGLDQVVQGDTGGDLSFEVTLTNEGTALIGQGATVDLVILARPADDLEDDSHDQQIGTLTDVDVSGMYHGDQLVLTITGLDFSGLDLGAYHLVVKLDGESLLGADADNNLAITDGSVSVVEASHDLSVELGDESDIPSSFVQGQTDVLAVEMAIGNQGNQITPSDATIAIAIIARPVDAQDDESDVTLHLNESYDVGSLPVGQSLSVLLDELDLSGLTPGSYDLILWIDDAGLANASDDNNSHTIENAFTVEAAVRDLSIAIDSYELPEDDFTEGDPAVASVTFSLTNEGNIAQKENTLVDVRIVARPADAADDSQDITLTTASDLDISGLAIGASESFTVDDIDLSSLGDGSYVLVAIVDDASLDNASDDNNESAAGEGIVVEAYGPDLELTVNGVNFESFTEGESGFGNRLHVVLTNVGEAATDGSASVNVTILARLVGETSGGTVVQAATPIDVADLVTGDYVDTLFNDMDLSILPAGEYELVVSVDDSGLDGATQGNNLVVVEGSFTVLPDTNQGI